MRLFKVRAKHRGIGYREALDEALCFGWIDGVTRRCDEDSFLQRFTPQVRPPSTGGTVRRRPIRSSRRR